MMQVFPVFLKGGTLYSLVCQQKRSQRIDTQLPLQVKNFKDKVFSHHSFELEEQNVNRVHFYYVTPYVFHHVT